MANDLRLQVLLQALDKASGPLRSIDQASKNASKSIRSTRESVRELQLEQVELKRTLDTGKISTMEYGRANTLLQGRIDQTTTALEIQTRAARNLGIQQQRLVQIERQRAQLGGKLMAAVGTAAVAGYALSRVVGPGNEFDYQLQLIGNTADMTGAQVEDLRQKIMAASKSTGQSAPTVEKALGFLVAAGLDADTAARSIQAIGRTSTAAGADIEDVSRAAFTLTDALNVKPEGLQKALDILAQAGKEGNVELRDMARQLPVLGAGFRSLKMGGNEATATLGAALEIARKGAADPDEAANNMRNYMAKVLSPATLKKAQDAFGLDLYKVIQDAQTSGGNPFEASIEAVMKATGGDQKKLGELFQDMQVQNFLKPIMQNWGEYQRIKAKALAATGVTDRDFDKIMGTAKQQLANAANAAGRLGLAFSHTLAPGLGKAASAITPVLDRMTKFVDAHPKLVSGIAKVVAGLVGMRIALLGIRYAWTFVGGSLAQRSITKLRGALAKQAAARLGAGAAPAAAGGGMSMLTGIGSAIAAIGLPVIALGVAIAAVGVLVWKYWGPIKAWFIGIGKGISDVMGPVLADLGPLKPLWDGIVSSLKSVWIWITQLFTPFHATSEQIAGATANGVTFGRVLGYVLGGVVTGIKWIAQAFDAVGTAIGETIGWVVVHAGKVADWFRASWAALTAIVKAPFVIAFGWIGTAARGVSTVASRIVDWFRASWAALTAIVKAPFVIAFGWIGTAARGVSTVASRIVEWFSTAWTSVTDAIKAPFIAAFGWITGKIDALMAKWEWIKAKLGADTAASTLAVAKDTQQSGSTRAAATLLTALAMANPIAAKGMDAGLRLGGSDSTPNITTSAPLRVGSSGSYATTNNVTVNAMPGHEESAAKAVAAELDRRDRAKAAATRSRLRDTE